MTSAKLSPPHVPGLRWKPAADSMWSAKYDTAFLQLECHTQRPAGVHALDGVLYIHMTPSETDAAEIEAWRAGIEAAVAERAELAAIKRRRYHGYAGPRHAAAVRAAIAEGHALYAEHGVAIRKVKPLTDLLDLVYLEPRELTKLRNVIRECRDNVYNMESDAIKLAKDVDVFLDDEFVEQSIRLLTDLDADRGAEKNERGWGRDTSAPGHWCCTLLRTDRTRAIEIGRGLVAHHLAQLAKLRLRPISAAAQCVIE